MATDIDYVFKDLHTPTQERYDIKAINGAINNILRTPEGSLEGMPDFGSRIQQIAFSQLDHITVDMLKRLIAEAITKWETRVQITSIDVQQIPEYNRIIADIKYRIRDDVFKRDSSVSVELNSV